MVCRIALSVRRNQRASKVLRYLTQVDGSHALTLNGAPMAIARARWVVNKAQDHLVQAVRFAERLVA